MEELLLQNLHHSKGERLHKWSSFDKYYVEGEKNPAK